MTMKDCILDVETDILDQYVNDKSSRPWVVAFSGGKDSTTLLQLVWNSVKKLPPSSRHRHIFVVCNNTLVENPKILRYVENQLELIQIAASRQSMPITVTHTTPSLQDTFWVNLIGKGYPAPNSIFRWCTDRLKIRPTTRYIQERISLYGEVIILLGTREEESSTRARSMKRYEIKGRRLRKHTLPNAYVFAPIKELSTQQIWWYLAENESPWHSNNIDLVHIYRNASDNNDCPLITDISTPACGRSRFGCWVCTVVRSDKTMQNLIETGEDWMTPLLELRNWLAKTIDRDDPNYEPEKYRMPVRRNFREGLGPYWPRWRKYILERLLRAEANVRKERPELNLITRQELVTIQLIWHRDHIYEYDVSQVLNEAYGKDMEFEDIGENVRTEKLLLKKACKPYESDYQLINNLLMAQKNRILLVNRRGLQKDIENILDEYLYQKFTDVYRKG
jgi:DNA sulfur modification protein DndC